MPTSFKAKAQRRQLLLFPYSESAKLLRHPLSGAIIAAEAGLPEEIVNLIATHSFEGDRSVRTREADFVRTIDDFVFKCTVAGLSKK